MCVINQQQSTWTWKQNNRHAKDKLDKFESKADRWQHSVVTPIMPPFFGLKYQNLSKRAIILAWKVGTTEYLSVSAPLIKVLWTFAVLTKKKEKKAGFSRK